VKEEEFAFDVKREMQHTAAHCNTLQHTATHCNIQLDLNTSNEVNMDGFPFDVKEEECSTLHYIERQTATHCNILQHTAHTATVGSVWPH